MTEFTEKDRSFIRKIAKKQADDKKETDSRLDALEAALITAQPTPVNMEHLTRHARVRKPNPGDSRVEDFMGPINEEAGHSIRIIFKDEEADPMKQRILIMSLYRTLKELCDQHGVAELSVKISNNPM